MHIIDETSHNQRLDNYLFKHYRHIPKSYIYRLLRTGQIRINKKRAKPSQKLIIHDHVRIPPMLVSEQKQPRTVYLDQALIDKCRGWVAHEDAHLLVIDKPPGISVHADTHGTPGLIELLQAVFKKPLYLAHRIDKETSGLVLIAQDRLSLVVLQDQFRERTVNKTYQALVAGHVGWQTKTVTMPLAKHPNDILVIPDERGKEAVSHFRCIQAHNTISHVLATPRTGRMHQLRVHLQALKLPIIGDPIYMAREARNAWRTFGIKRLCLHARELQFTHPHNKTNMTITSQHDLFMQYKNTSPTQ